jgi:hypothetical protein
VYAPDFCEVDADCGDGRVCDAIGLCAFPNTCDAPVDLPVGRPQLGNTANSESFEFAGCGNNADSPDHVWRFSPEEAGAFCITTQGSDFETVVHIRAAECAEPIAEIGCAANGDSLALDADAGVEYFVIVDGDNASGQYFLTAIAGACP